MNNLRKQQNNVFDALELPNNNLISVVSARDNYEADTRICLTMVYFLPHEIKSKIRRLIINPLQKHDPEQYYYTDDALHVTIQNVRSISDPPSFTENDIEKIKNLNDEISSQKNLSFDLDGLFKMSGSVGIKCYPTQNTQDFILSLRKKLANIGIPDDKKYVNNIVVSNVTFCRFYNPPNEAFIQHFKRLQKITLGQIKIDRISLVKTNAVFFKEKKQIIRTFELS